MVWPFSSSSSTSATDATPTNPKSSGPKSQDGGYVAPDRSARERCYESRDRLFACLDRNDILDAVREDEKSRRVCKEENEGYERDCARAWVSLSFLGLWIQWDLGMVAGGEGKDGSLS
jgi:Cytochrome oxidase c subunit VIb